ncbi:hypothetical protein PS15p_205340 [Mucor circinelloides]
MPKINNNKRISNSQKSAIPRPLNSFMIFRMEHQASVSKEYPGAAHQEISKKLSKKWRGLTPEEREVYDKKALDAKLEHKLLYPDYKYCPRRRDASSRKTKKSGNSKSSAVQTDSSPGDHQPQIQAINTLNEQPCQLTSTAFFNSLHPVDVTFDQFSAPNNSMLTTSLCYDNTLLCPTLNESFYQDPSASPSEFSMMSQYSGLSSSLLSEYDSTTSHYSGYYDTMTVYPYYCGQLPNTYMPSSYECAPIIEYSQIDPVTIPLDFYHVPFSDFMATPPAILDHTQPLLENDAQETAHGVCSNSFYASALTSDPPLLTQPFFCMDIYTMPQRIE